MRAVAEEVWNQRYGKKSKMQARTYKTDMRRRKRHAEAQQDEIDEQEEACEEWLANEANYHDAESDSEGDY